jgi:hypothetical protein
MYLLLRLNCEQGQRIGFRIFIVSQAGIRLLLVSPSTPHPRRDFLQIAPDHSLAWIS